jgi:phosphotriesterase-related protein
MGTRREFLAQIAVASVAAASAHAAQALKAAAPVTISPIQRNRGVVQTVQGPIDASKLGFTLPHEHICASSAGFMQTWPEFFGGRANFISKVVDRRKAVRDEGGVDTIVDVTPADIGRDIRLIQEVSRKSGMQIVACTGHWLYPSLSMGARTSNELADFFVLEIERGIEGTDIKPGVIKVATDHEGVTPFLEKALRAAARASNATGIPIITHTYAVDRIGEKQADIFENEGLHPAMVCLGHSDETDDMTYLTDLAKRGYTIGMDHLTSGAQAATGASTKILSWQQRAQGVKKLVDTGFGSKIFLSNDWYFGVSLAGTGAMEAMEKMNPDGMLFNSRKTIPYLKQIGVTDQQDSARRGTRRACEHGSVHATSSLPHADFDEPASVSKATQASISAKPDAQQRTRRRQRGF